MKYRALAGTLVILSVFFSGVLVGWLWWGPLSVDDATAARIQESTRLQTSPGGNGQLADQGFRQLLELARYSEAIRVMQDVNGPLARQQRIQFREVLETLAKTGQCDAQQQLLDIYLERFSARVDELVLQARCQMLQERYAVAIGTLQEAMLLDLSERELRDIAALVQQAVSTNDVMLRERGRLGELDSFYQSLLVQEPGNSDYYLRLADVRRDSGDLEGAVGVLLHIQYDPQLGDAARQRLESLQQEMARGQEQTRVIELREEGIQLIVRATLDGSKELNLLVDTGAELSVIVPEVLAQMGYELSGRELSTFRTANGVRDAPIIRVHSLTLDDLTQAGLQVGSLSLELGPGVDGLLGMNFLGHYRFSIDNQARLLYLAPR